MHDRPRRPRRIISSLGLIVGLILTMLTPLTTLGAADFTISLPQVTKGFASPTQVTNAGDGTDRLFVVERRGTIRVVKNGVIQSGYFLDIRSKVEDGGERGLLGLAFDPDFATNRRLYVFYTRNGGDIVVSRFTANSARTKVSASTAAPLLLIEHSALSNHNGGSMAFGPDGYLYIGVGDGGGAGDPRNNAQNKNTLLGKILRIDTRGTGSGKFDRYSVPVGNPYRGSVPGLQEIWARGVRNPWRISFDRGTGDLFISDVGQERYEEVNRQLSGAAGGANYGWKVMEGLHCYTSSSCSLAGDTLPVLEYGHAGGSCSITGGYVYRGSTQPDLVGLYVFADYCSGMFWTMNPDGSGKTLRRDAKINPSSFGEGEDGEIYMVSIGGGLYRIVAS